MPKIKYERTETYERLVDKHSVFDTYYDVLVFLAVVGYEEREYVADAETGGDGEINFSSIPNLYRTIVSSLAFQRTGEPSALVDRERQIEVLSAYAAGGDRVLQTEVGSLATDPTDEIVSYVRSARENERERDEGILGDIVQSFDEEIIGSLD